MSDDLNATGPHAPRSPAASPWRSRTSNRPLAARANGNSKQGRRIRDLYRGLLDKIGGDPSDVIGRADVLRAVELRVVCEDLRAKMLAGETIDPDQLIRLESLTARAERRLAKFAVPAKPVTSLAEHIAKRAAAPAGA
jgi:hypothetical protein